MKQILAAYYYLDQVAHEFVLINEQIAGRREAQMVIPNLQVKIVKFAGEGKLSG